MNLKPKLEVELDVDRIRGSRMFGNWGRLRNHGCHFYLNYETLHIAPLPSEALSPHPGKTPIEPEKQAVSDIVQSMTLLLVYNKEV
jgi:hypothetical protein